jgi:hypothetical protein
MEFKLPFEFNFSDGNFSDGLHKESVLIIM